MRITQSHYLSSPIEYLKGVGPQRADTFKKELQIFTFDDLLHHLPFRYIDRTKTYLIKDINDDTQYIQLKGRLSNIKIVGNVRQKRLTAWLSDKSGKIELVWFKGVSWVEKILKENSEYLIFGKPNLYKNHFSFAHPDIEPAESESENPSAGVLQPVYPSTENLKRKNLDSKGILKLMKTLGAGLVKNDLPEILPANLIAKYRLVSPFEAYKNIHFPETEKQLAQARNRLKFEELFLLQLSLLQMKQFRKVNYKGFVFQHLGQYFNSFYKEGLPFQLTNAQKRVLKEIRSDLLSGKQMNRLLQGDVGSGKTIVALMCMLMALDNNFQACLMAPTEILAQQHFQNISRLVGKMNLNLGLLTSSVKGKERKEILNKLENGELQLLIGTHSLIEDTVKFQQLGLVIIDEQHRFGVEQRAKLWTKNEQNPHILVMTATPIPRTLAMTLYGELDVSVIDELPPGRKLVQTIHRFDSSRLAVFGFIREQIALGRQVYIVYPLIEESEKLDYKDLMDGYESISREFPLPKYKVGVMHGRMTADAKAAEMARFIKGETNILVATTVIEVGVDVPNASVMIVESAERFGLSQLHQLRGRVGRGAEKSYCILMTGNKLTSDARERMNTMVKTNDGFIIAEKDLQLRGPGDLQGTQQSGILNFIIADLARDYRILEAARNEAEQLLKDDPFLDNPVNQPLKSFLTLQKEKKKTWSRIS
jgi:ATP-dependent DNA helicase RecG